VSQAFTGRRGLQPERTALAWQRATLGVLANGGLFALRSVGLPLPLVPSLVLAVALLLLALLLAVVGRRREGLLAATSVPATLRPDRAVAVVGWAVVLVCAGGAVVLALPT
jgi:uncharacterized membrane protein YidH (DUF202 family)